MPPRNSPTSRTIVVDVGATWIRAGHPGSPRPHYRRQIPHHRSAALDEVASAIRATSTPAANQIFVAVPGLVTPEGAVEAALHSPIRDVDVAAALTTRLRWEGKIVVVNDANAQAAGVAVSEKKCIAHLHLALGTAVGGAVILDGRVRGGASGFAGEVGHIPTQVAHGLCACGRARCVDLVASGWSIERDLGADWWRRDDMRVPERLRTAAVAVAEAVETSAAILDLASCSFAGNLCRLRPFRAAVRQAIPDHIRCSWYRSSWKLVGLGAEQAFETSAEV